MSKKQILIDYSFREHRIYGSRLNSFMDDPNMPYFSLGSRYSFPNIRNKVRRFQVTELTTGSAKFYIDINNIFDWQYVPERVLSGEVTISTALTTRDAILAQGPNLDFNTNINPTGLMTKYDLSINDLIGIKIASEQWSLAHPVYDYMPCTYSVGTDKALDSGFVKVGVGRLCQLHPKRKLYISNDKTRILFTQDIYISTYWDNYLLMSKNYLGKLSITAQIKTYQYNDYECNRIDEIMNIGFSRTGKFPRSSIY